jgi:2-polyprenyl-3-methyl-5-hydroxy-6-metoxy-1,4-benzoquinol methylase
MDRFSENQAEGYWKSQHVRAGKLDREIDPDALGNVCHAGTPLWFNQYYARYQRGVFAELLSNCPAPTRESRALDIGCGAGRWTRLLAASGYRVHGIDLQQALIDSNRVRYPETTFDCVSVLDFQPTSPFDVVSTVTVLQHIPFPEQKIAVAKIGSFVKPGGHAVILENVHDQDVHVFAQSIASWQDLFGAAGFRTILVRRYDYSPATRISGFMAAAAGKLMRRTGLQKRPNGPQVPVGVADSVDGKDTSSSSRLIDAARSVGWLARRGALTIDDRVEPLLIRMNIDLPTVHCGFLFQKNA